MSTLVRTSTGYNGFKTVNFMELTDLQGNEQRYYKENIKQMIKNGEITPIDFQLDRAGRLIAKKVEFKFNPAQLSANEIEMVLFYGTAKLQQLKTNKKIEIYNMLIKMGTIPPFDMFELVNGDGTGNHIKKYWNNSSSYHDTILKMMYEVSRA